MNQNTKMLLGALVAAALAIATYYGLVSPQTASSIQNQANQTLGTAPQQTTQQGLPPQQSQQAPVPPSAPAPQPAPQPAAR